ncbi:MAG: hypothetical protein ACT4NL_18630 [Pseudomarimonas sp.]
MNTSRNQSHRLSLLTQLCLLGSAAIHLLPLAGLPGAAALMRLYGLSEIDAGTELLLQHRALMFGLMGGGLLAAIRYPRWHLPMVSIVLLSDLGFLLLCALHWPLNDALQRVAMFDAASIVFLLIAAISLQRAKR